MKQPNILYTAAKALIRNNEGKVLILKQSDTTISGGNRYHPPGGILELGESIEECLVREIKEEIGVDSFTTGLYDVGEWQAKRDDDIMQFVGIFYLCSLKADDFSMQQEEVSELHWVGLDDIDSINIMEPSKAIIKKLLLSSL